ncbi:MAG: HD domain-containing protein [Microgenomates group bacterium]|nr:HD domain-containing protein [Microgenomates group bacterium]
MFKLPEDINHFLKFFQKQGFQIYIVGGAVRSLLMNLPIKNWDFTTNAKPEEIIKLFPQAFYNNQYGTVSVPLKINQSDDLKPSQLILEVTPFRKEGKYLDFRHPKKISWAKTLKEDLSRRDFTINAMAYDGKKIIDPFDGRKDLQNKLIKAVGNPDERFNEDALRLLRAIRLASELGFFIEEETKKSIKKNARLITKISWERIRDELLRILASHYPAEGIIFLKNTNLLKYILPELDVCFAIPQKSPKRHHIFDVGTHSIMSLKYCPSKDVITRLATLLHDIGKAKTYRRDETTGLITFYNHEIVGTKLAKEIAHRLKLSNEQTDKFVRLVKYHQFTVSELQTDNAIRRFIREVGKENLPDILDLRTGDRIGSGAKPTSWRLELFKKRLVEVQKEPFKITDLKINGNDVMKILKIKPGPKVGQVLKKLFDQVVNKKIENKREALINEIKKMN